MITARLASIGKRRIVASSNKSTAVLDFGVKLVVIAVFIESRV